MVFFNKILDAGCGERGSWFPGVFVRWVSFPSNAVAVGLRAVVEAGVNYSGDKENVGFLILKVREWWRAIMFARREALVIVWVIRAK